MRYPIEIVPYDPLWPEAYERERQRIASALQDRVVRYEHMGSTAVPGLESKPTIDISAAVRSLEDVVHLLPVLAELGYEEMESNSSDRRDFSRRGDSDKPSHILHFMVDGSPAWIRPLVFRNALRRHPGLRDCYAELKRSLAEEFGEDNRKYNIAKSDFIHGVVEDNLGSYEE